MADKLEFRNKLGGILALATEHDYKLTCEQVEKYFEEDALSKEQMELVFDYLQAQKVAVKGYVKSGGKVVEAREEAPRIKLTQEEIGYLEEYQEDLRAIKPATQGELLEKFRGVVRGDTIAKGRVTELYLDKVVEIGKEMYHPEVFLGDIIQEGNVSLMLALESLLDIDEVGVEAIEEFLELEIRQGIQLLIEEMTELKNRDLKMIEQVENLEESISKLTEDLGRKVTVDELAIYTDMSEAEIMEILKLTGEDVEDMEEEIVAEGVEIEVLGSEEQ